MKTSIFVLFEALIGNEGIKFYLKVLSFPHSIYIRLSQWAGQILFFFGLMSHLRI